MDKLDRRAVPDMSAARCLKFYCIVGIQSGGRGFWDTDPCWSFEVMTGGLASWLTRGLGSYCYGVNSDFALKHDQ